ncbi:MAG: class I SAM-dependent methyltransferase [Bacteroidetes bacterium]|nr:class I SAM-dependent methyltransferase [Bacteroidota bacterium]
MEWIEILKCPSSGSNLHAAEDATIKDLNQKIETGEIFQADGNPFKGTLEKALVSDDGNYIYPIINDIILLRKDLALVKQKGNLAQNSISDEKKLVQDFYNNRGWFTDEAGNYEDAVIFEDLRDVSKEYLKKCHDRVSRFLNPSGKYMLDAASGALQYDDYLQYSENFKYRVCVDLSFQALREVKKKLGDKSLCVLCDMTNMPFKDNVMDGFVSLNTIYHIPKDEQALAIKELYRLLSVKGKGVVVYDWYKHSPWMNFWLLPFRGAVYIKNRIMGLFHKVGGMPAQSKMLYFYAHDYTYFKNNLPPFQLKVWRSISVPFMKAYIHPWLGGKKILDRIYQLEEKNPENCGLKGEYPMLVFEK